MESRRASLPGAGDATDLTQALIARLGLPPGATGAEIEDTRAELVTFLRSAPAGVRPWARQQISNVEAAAVLLRGPEVGLAAEADAWAGPGTEAGQGTGPGAGAGPDAGGDDAATDAAAAAPRQRRIARADLTDEELDAYERGEQPDDEDDPDSGAAGLAHRPARGQRQGTTAKRPAGRPGRPLPSRSARPAGQWRLLRSRRIQVAVVLLALAGLVYTVYNSGSPGTVPGISASATVSPSPQAVDQATVAALMRKLTVNPKDLATLRSLGDIYFAAGDYQTAAGWQQKILAISPSDITAQLALGAAEFNLGNQAEAKQDWLKVVALDPKQAEAHYDLGFLYLSENPPDLAKVRSEWNTVISIDPTSDIAKNVATHLKTLESQSASPSASSSASASPSSSAGK